MCEENTLEPQTAHRGGSKQATMLRSAYLGKPADLTPDRFNTVAT
jgi:hypothetical protein